LQKTLAWGDRFFPVGFYFKWFNRPAVLSRLFLRGLRPVAGIGRFPAATAWQQFQVETAQAAADSAPDWGQFDRVIVGSGPSGLQAAATAFGRTLLVDDQGGPGGQRKPVFDLLADDYGESLKQIPILEAGRSALAKGLEIFTKTRRDRDFTTCWGGKVVAGYQPDRLLLHDGRRLVSLRSPGLTWAAGAWDTLGLFPGNDLPGLLGPRALYRFLVRDGLRVRGQRAVVYGCGFDLWLAAALLHARGARVTVVLMQRDGPAEVASAMDMGWQLQIGMQLVQADQKGNHLLLSFQSAASAPHPTTPDLRLWADLAVIARRGKPTYDIPYQLGADLVLDPARGGYVPRPLPPPSAIPHPPNAQAISITGEARGLAVEQVFASLEEKQP
jgi:hypothetical protein